MQSTISGFPRIGDRRELKTATEGYWAGRVPAEELEATARELRRQTWTFLRDIGLGQVPSQGSVKVAVCGKCPGMPVGGTCLPTWGSTPPCGAGW